MGTRDPEIDALMRRLQELAIELRGCADAARLAGEANLAQRIVVWAAVIETSVTAMIEGVQR